MSKASLLLLALLTSGFTGCAQTVVYEVSSDGSAPRLAEDRLP